MKKRMMTFLLAVSACALLAGCGKDTAPKKDTSAKKETTTKKDDNHDNDAKSPLTGEWIEHSSSISLANSSLLYS